MKLYTFTILMVAISLSLARSAEEAKAMPVENGEKLAAELNIVINEQADIPNNTVVLSKQLTFKAGEFLIEQAYTRKVATIVVMDIDIRDVGNEAVARGRIYECDFYTHACKKLLDEMALSSMPIVILAQQYEIMKNGIGNLCFIVKDHDRTTFTSTTFPKKIYFVRGNTAIMIRTIQPTEHIYDIAKALDYVLTGQKIEETTTKPE